MGTKMTNRLVIAIIVTVLFGLILLSNYILDGGSIYTPRKNLYYNTTKGYEGKQQRGYKYRYNTTQTNKHENMSNCEIKQPTTSSKRLPVTALVSFPASGNTWTRHLLQQLTGK